MDEDQAFVKLQDFLALANELLHSGYYTRGEVIHALKQEWEMLDDEE